MVSLLGVLLVLAEVHTRFAAQKHPGGGGEVLAGQSGGLVGFTMLPYDFFTKGDRLEWGHIRILYKAPKDYTKPRQTIQSPKRLHKDIYY